MSLDLSRAFCLAGPTAVGKSAVALDLAEAVQGEIVSVDSMQVYRGLDLGTAKPSRADRQRVPHHLIDEVDLTETFDAARFVGRATAVAAEVLARGRVPIFCGGTGFYFKALIEGLDDAPPIDPELRAALEATPRSELLEELARRDPATWARIDRQNPRRVVRALEVIRRTGQPLPAPRPAWQPAGAAARSPAAVPLIVLQRSAEDLRARIGRRVDAMFAAGLVDETRRLLERGLGSNRTALQAIGYRQVMEHLRGERSLAETIALVKQKTWQFARRQATWFRHQMPCRRLDLQPNDDPRDTARILAAGIKA